MADPSIRLLLVDDEEDYRHSCLKYMLKKGHDAIGAASGADAWSMLERETFDVAVFDIDMPGMNGHELMQRVAESDISLEVIFLTGQGSIESAVSAMKLGACDYLTKPCSLGDLEHHIQLAYERGRLRKENGQLKALVSRSRPLPQLIGQSLAIREIKRIIEKIARTSKPVLIEGESGTGKEVVARLIQQSSNLSDRPFVTINCAALPEQLVESELFGHQKGSFTGATADKPGLFEIADGGTLFIDEVGELPLSLQPKLLRVLEDGSMRRIGCHRERRVKVRLIAATNRDLREEVAAGRFREDLYYRINVLSMKLPALNEREGDIPLLIEHFLPRGWTIDEAAIQVMNRYPWPGNVRQLINVLERSVILSDQHEITVDDLPHELFEDPHALVSPSATDSISSSFGMPSASGLEPSKHARSASSGDTSEYLRVDELVRAHVLQVLANVGGNKAAAARKLGIHRRKLYRLLERYQQPLGAESSVIGAEDYVNET